MGPEWEVNGTQSGVTTELIRRSSENVITALQFPFYEANTMLTKTIKLNIGKNIQNGKILFYAFAIYLFNGNRINEL